MKIALSHGQVLIRELLASHIERSIDAQVFQVAGIDHLLTLTSEDGPFDLSIINCPHDLWGLEPIRLCLEASGGKPVVLMSGSVDSDMIHEALELGIAGYFPLSMGAASMINAIRFVLSGEKYVPPVLILDANIYEIGKVRLTRREREVLNLIGAGKTNKEIAQKLGLAEVTIKMHVRALCLKFEARNRTQLAVSTGIGLRYIEDFHAPAVPAAVLTDDQSALEAGAGGWLEEDKCPKTRG
ncbi:LuxR C-terminal-related transcriptional regulator [Cereibacter sphaeroides]|uniref:response regulator transcription factor n=1 Tax=Cereibacter sphaeroides TaxID=1063 RepID=UPI003FCD5780